MTDASATMYILLKKTKLMKDFDIHIQTRLIFGRGKEQAFYKAVEECGKRIFIVIGGGSVERLGYLGRVQHGLKKAGVETTLFKGIEPNPTSKTINKAAEEARNFNAEVILALGGGSVMDASKAIAALVKTGEKDIWPYVLGEPKSGKLTGVIPIAAIPTTAATASEVTPYAVISNPEVNGKAPLGYPFMRPVVSWLNPEFTLDLPPVTTRDGASDIMSHVFENYILGGNQSPLADRYSEGILSTVMQTLPLVISDPDNYELRARMLWASNLALNGYQHAGRNPSGFILHAMEHAVSGFYPKIAHGRGLATLYPAYFRWLWKQDRCRDRFAQLGERLFGLEGDDISFGALSFISHFEDWLRENHLFQSLTDIGVSKDVFPEIAEYTVAVYGDGKKMDACGPMTVSDIVDVFERTERNKIPI